jgi:hypothetical protein
MYLRATMAPYLLMDKQELEKHLQWRAFVTNLSLRASYQTPLRTSLGILPKLRRTKSGFDNENCSFIYLLINIVPGFCIYLK